jgi:phosphoglycerate dehydrogenase-like enzyme
VLAASRLRAAACCRRRPATDNFINAARLARDEALGWLLNFGRGHIIKDDDLIAA